MINRRACAVIMTSLVTVTEPHDDWSFSAFITTNTQSTGFLVTCLTELHYPVLIQT